MSVLFSSCRSLLILSSSPYPIFNLPTLSLRFISFFLLSLSTFLHLCSSNVSSTMVGLPVRQMNVIKHKGEHNVMESETLPVGL